MEIFLGAEIEGPATSKWFELQKEFSQLLLAIKDIDYGITLTRISIISIIMRPEFFQEGGYKERRYFSKKAKEADIRLRMNYSEFITARTEQRKKIYVAHILEAIFIAGKKAGEEFNVDRLLHDVEHILR